MTETKKKPSRAKAVKKQKSRPTLVELNAHARKSAEDRKKADK